jgi:hypothetical protein
MKLPTKEQCISFAMRLSVQYDDPVNEIGDTLPGEIILTDEMLGRLVEFCQMPQCETANDTNNVLSGSKNCGIYTPTFRFRWFGEQKMHKMQVRQLTYIGKTTIEPGDQQWLVLQQWWEDGYGSGEWREVEYEE